MIIKCPHCDREFNLDENEVSGVISQIRDADFEKAVEKRVAEMRSYMEKAHKQDCEKIKLESESKCEKDLLKAQTEKDRLQSELDKEQELGKAKIEAAKMQVRQECMDENAKKIDELKADYDAKLKDAEEELGYYKDLKAKMSTKMVGETLEQHCEAEFNKIRMTAFPNAYFEKDNEVSETGSKGDFIFREEEDGVELISIMFEMKNEMDTTATKHKNADFFKELDKDRKEKGCEYAVLVTLLEADSDYYNQGIVDVSYKYPKMYVVRPQMFLTIIGLLRNMARNSLSYKKELDVVKKQDIDLLKFEEDLETFKGGFGRNCELFQRKFNESIAEIDKAIDHLQKTKAAMLSSSNNLRLADKKLEDLSVKSLAKNNDSIMQRYEEAKKSSKE